MMNNARMLLALSSLSGAVALPSAASAAAVVSSCGSGSSCIISFDGAAGIFGNAKATKSPFTDRYLFDLGAGFLTFTLTTNYAGRVGSAQDINFNLVQISPLGRGVSTDVPLIPTTDEIYQLRNTPVTAGQYELRLQGTGRNLNASYSGTLNFIAAAVPEPATWLMMILGFGFVGGALRRQNKYRQTLTYA